MMAKMIPHVDPRSLEHGSEAPVYVALRDQLDDEYVALHSYPWLRPWRADALLEGEADFVILHPERGLLVLEVKGGATIQYDGRQWSRQTKEGPRPFQDPFHQARRNMHALLDIIKERSNGELSRRDLTYGYAVVFPHMDYEGAPPPHADDAIIISRRDLSSMDQAITRAFDGWTVTPRPLSSARFRALRDGCLLPTFRIFRPLGLDIAQASDRLLQLTETQARVFEGLYAQDRVLVTGVAGSGKTILALRRALSFAQEGHKTLFVCYNSALAAWLRRRVEEDPTTSSYRDHLDVKHFHGLARDLAASADIDFRPASGGLEAAFWEHEAPDIMEQAALELGVHYDAIVVDEAQDFSLGWWYALTQSLLADADGPLYAFMDPNQSLRGDAQMPDINFTSRFTLTINCRNTRRVAAASAAVLDLPLDPFPRAPVGGDLRLLRASSPAQQKGLVIREARALLGRGDVSPDQIALIGPASKARGSLAGLDEIGGTPLLTDPARWRDGHGLLVTTARAFKGLEADVVILYDLGGFSGLFKREDLYVACTRARAQLIAIAHGDECRQLLMAARAASEAQS